MTWQQWLQQLNCVSPDWGTSKSVWPPKRSAAQQAAEHLPLCVSEGRSLDALDLAVPARRAGGAVQSKSSSTLQALDLAPVMSRQAKRAAADVRRVIHALNRDHPTVRIGFASAPGYGHQSASLLVARRLRALGYTGWLDLVCAQAAREKLSHLLPGVSPKATEVQIFARERVRVLPQDADKPQVAVGIFGGLDAPTIRSAWIQAETCLVLQPLQWAEESGLLRAGKFTRLRLDKNLGYREVAATPVSLSGLLERAMQGRADLPGLLQLVQAVQSGRADLMLVYGLHRSPPEVLPNLLAGMQLAQQARGTAAKPTIVLVVRQRPVEVRGRSPRRVAAAPSLVASMDSATPAAIDSATLASTPVFQTDSLPEPVFRALLRLSTWPPAVEGANATNAMRLARAPYMSVNDWTTQLPRLHPGDRGATRAHDATEALCRARPSAADAACIAAALVAAREPASLERAYFAALGAALWRPGPDKLESGLLELGRSLKILPPRAPSGRPPAG